MSNKKFFKRITQKITAVFLATILLTSFVPTFSTFSTANAAAVESIDPYERLNHHITTLATFSDRYHFTEYLIDHAHATRPAAEYIINAADYTLAEGMNIELLPDFEGQPGISILTDEEGLVEWQVSVAQSGLYNISVLYFATPGRSSDVQRAIFINGESPFFEASPIEFRRTWVNQHAEIQQDNQGNDIRPTQIEFPMWAESVIQDAMGTYNEPFLFYLNAGVNTIGLLSQREPMAIRHIRVHQIPDTPTYAEFSANLQGLPQATIANVAPIRIEGEAAVRKSSPMLAPQADTAGPGVQPYSARYIRINNIGGTSWSEPGSWLEWEVDIAEPGLYKIAMNVRQNFHRGSNSFRRLTINGEVPFEEMSSIPFTFQNGWRVETMGGEDNPHLFWFEPGRHTIRIEAVLGDYAPFVRQINDSVFRLNELYRQIVMITGITPDRFRDYQIGQRLPHLQAALQAEEQLLTGIFDQLTEMADGRGERNTSIRTIAQLLQRMHSNVEDIPIRLADFRINIGSLGTWLMLVREQMLAVDALYILPVDAPTPDNGSRWWRQVWHEIQTLFYSFIIDYNAIGNVVDGQTREIEVWIGTGRDQANVVRRLIDESFTNNTGIGVSLMLVDMATLLPATVAGQGPDVTLSVGNTIPMDFGMRGAIADLSHFPDFAEVIQRFPPAAMEPYSFQDWTFALPETLSFPMLFYRRDILHEIGIIPPQTWDDVRSAIATMSMHHMVFGLPAGDFPHFSYFMFLFQHGGYIYNEDATLSGLDSDIALSAFRDFTRFYTDYNLDRFFDFVNRFRNGEMPLAVVDYTAYNVLQVFAPEIRGLWGIAPVPATIMADGSLNRAVPATGTAAIMMEQASDPDAAWEFLKWWTSADTQTQFGREMESIMGSAARHPTANLEAFSRLPWPVQDYRSLQYQFQFVRGIPEVPGGYFTPRQVRNAFFTAVELRTIGPREALTDFTRFINDEIRAKRREFGLHYVS